MRIISGKFKKANLFSVPGKTTRPTTDYVKEVIFNIVQSIAGKNVLDLYAGSGSLGLEALSRGADFVSLVDFSEKAIKTMIKNLQKLGCQEDCRIYKKKVSSFLKKQAETFDIIFLDPPYNKALVNKTIKLIIENELLNEEGKIIIEHSPTEKLEPLTDFDIDYREISKTTAITIISRL